jgi:hypothetical protein
VTDVDCTGVVVVMAEKARAPDRAPKRLERRPPSRSLGVRADPSVIVVSVRDVWKDLFRCSLIMW